MSQITHLVGTTKKMEAHYCAEVLVFFFCAQHPSNLNMRQDAREAAAFIRPMLEMDPDKRASAQEMLEHPWLQEMGPAADEVSLC